MTTKKKMSKGVKVSACAHPSWLVKDTDTEYGEIVICTRCGHSQLKTDWIASHTPSKVKKESLIFDAAMLYAVGYLFLLLLYVIMGGN